MDKFYAIADPTRRTIVEILAKKGRLSATAISDKFTMSMPAISQHLKVLREAKLVRVEKDGQHRIYHLNIDTMNDIEKWSQQMSHLWMQQFDKLDALLKVGKNKQK
ncbi:MAG: metalloregulator ArsR/SmtB family transcription factor [Candidatus Paceibacterota bacterium]